MRVHNVHERTLGAPAAAVGALLDGVGGPHDALWPSPEWAPMRLEGPPAVGVPGGHGSLRYRITDYEPGRRVVFTLDPGQGLSGWHGFEVVPRGPERAVLRHAVDARAHGWMRVVWPCVLRPVHDGIVEQILDRAEIALGTGPARPTELAAIARLARWTARPRARATAPSEPIGGALPEVDFVALPLVDFVDAHAVRLRPGMPTDPAIWASAIFDHPPLWVRVLLVAREAVVGLVGIERVGRSAFAVRTRTDTEAQVGVDAGHLDFRAVASVEPARIVVTTLVRRHNRRGRGYFALVRRIHPAVMRAMLTRAATRLSRAAASTAPVGVR
jgi:uncharacterized protein DUF2867